MKRTQVIGSVADDFAEKQKTLKKIEKKKTKHVLKTRRSTLYVRQGSSLSDQYLLLSEQYGILHMCKSL